MNYLCIFSPIDEVLNVIDRTYKYDDADADGEGDGYGVNQNHWPFLYFF